jgi:hypothetical protein
MPIADVVALLELTDLKRAGRELVGPCPKCGGDDRFAVNVDKGVFQCRICHGKGGAVDLVMFCLDLTFPAALTWLFGERSEISPEERQRRAARAEENKRRHERIAAKLRAESMALAVKVWKEASQSIEGSPVRLYLERRGISRELLPDLPKCLRYAPDLAYTIDRGNGWETLFRGPAMVASITDPKGELIGVHRTWIDLEQASGKRQILEPSSGKELPAKKVLGSKKGGAIRLSGRLQSPSLIMGEGIETTLSGMVAGVYPGAMFWAGVDLGNMAGHRKLGEGLKYAGLPDMADREAFVPPAYVDRLIYIQDGDSDPRLTRAKLLAGLRRAMALKRGRKGQIVAAPIDFDLNDVLQGKRPRSNEGELDG